MQRGPSVWVGLLVLAACEESSDPDGTGGSAGGSVAVTSATSSGASATISTSATRGAGGEGGEGGSGPSATKKICDLTGPGTSSKQFGVGGTDLGIPVRQPDGKIAYIFGDTFENDG